MLTQLCDYIKNHWIVHFNMVTFIVCLVELGEKYSNPWDCCGWGRLWETRTNTPLIATKGKRKSYSLDKPKGNSFVSGISSAVLKLLNTIQRLSREGQQQQNERNKKGEGRWEKKTTGGRWMEEEKCGKSQRRWPGWAKAFFDHRNLQKGWKYPRRGGPRAKATSIQTVTYVARKQGWFNLTLWPWGQISDPSWASTSSLQTQCDS